MARRVRAGVRPGLLLLLLLALFTSVNLSFISGARTSTRAGLATRPTTRSAVPEAVVGAAMALSSAVLCSGLQRASEMMEAMYPTIQHHVERHVDLVEERADRLVRDVRWNLEDMLEDLFQGGEPDPGPMPEFLEKARSNGRVMIGVTGSSGAGKSSVVNALRSLKDSDENAAQTGITETTLQPAMYEWRARPGHSGDEVPEVVLWDLPGIGTPRFPKKTYVDDLGIRHFDMVILLSAARFTEADQWLMLQLKAFGVPCFLVRNKIDADIRSELLNLEDEDDDEDPDRARELQQEVTRQTIEIVKQDLREQAWGEPYVYCISTRRRSRKHHDFPKLIDDLVRAVETCVRERRKASP